MAIKDLIANLEQYRNASAAAPPAGVEQDYSQVAQSVPEDHLAGGLADAFRSDQTPPFPQMLGTLFNNSDPQQRAGILNHLLGAAGPSLLSGGALSGLAGLLRSGTGITPDQASQISPQAIQQMAENAQQKNPSVIDTASNFYARHPTLVKSLGAGALALIMSHVSRRSSS